MVPAEEDQQYQQPRPAAAAPEEVLVDDLADCDRAFSLIEAIPSEGEVA